MKITCTVTLDIDPAAYAEEYNLSPDEDVAADVQRHVQTSMHAHFDALGVLNL